MPEVINDRNVFSLGEVALSIQKTIAQRYSTAFWVRAEMNKLNHYAYSGHCYPELLEKVNGKVTAQMKATLWKSDYLSANARFLKVLKEPLKDGIKILFLATVNFDPSYGLSLRILDIDPVFSLGELEREKQETIERLQKEEIFDQNKKLKLSILPKRIAVISVETSKGYGDFISILDNNPWGYKFFTYLFPSLLQGDQSITAIIQQMSQIRKVTHHFEAVAIIRGGGGDVGLSSFNNYELAREVATFPLPVITGIGHSTNETVTELVSFMNAITPTELADFLIQKFHNFSIPVKQAQEVIINEAAALLSTENLRFRHAMTYLKGIVNGRLSNSRHEISTQASILMQSVRFQFRMEQESLATLQKSVNFLDPVNVLRRGFSITVYNGKVVKNTKGIKQGDSLTTLVSDGQIQSTIDKIQ